MSDEIKNLIFGILNLNNDTLKLEELLKLNY